MTFLLPFFFILPFGLPNHSWIEWRARFKFTWISAGNERWCLLFSQKHIFIFFLIGWIYEVCLKSLCPRFCSSKQSFKQSSQVQKSTGVTCDPLFIRTQQQQCHVRHSHCDIIRKKQAVTELFQLLTKKKYFFFTLFLSTSAKFNQFCNFRFVHSPQIFNQLFYEKKQIALLLSALRASAKLVRFWNFLFVRLPKK